MFEDLSEEEPRLFYTSEEKKSYGKWMFYGGCSVGAIVMLIIDFVSLWVLGGILVD